MCIWFFMSIICIFWNVWLLYHKIKYSIWLLKLRWIFPSVWTCALMADYFARLIKTWDKPFWHAWPVCSCLMHVFCGQCVIWTKNTIYLSKNKWLFFLIFLAQFSPNTSTFRGAARPGKPKKNGKWAERQIIHIVDWCENITSLVIQDRAASDCMFFKHTTLFVVGVDDESFICYGIYYWKHFLKE